MYIVRRGGRRAESEKEWRERRREREKRGRERKVGEGEKWEREREGEGGIKNESDGPTLSHPSRQGIHMPSLQLL